MRAPHPEVPTPMFHLLRRLAATALLGLAFAIPAHATPYSTDYSDLWWVGPAEDGWGVNFIQQGDIIFATFFVYGPDSTARWFVAPAMRPTGTQPSTGHRFSGDLYQTTGPWFGGTFDPTQVAGSVVGTAMVTFDSPDTATAHVHGERHARGEGHHAPDLPLQLRRRVLLRRPGGHRLAVPDGLRQRPRSTSWGR